MSNGFYGLCCCVDECAGTRFVFLFAAGSVMEQIFDFMADAYHAIRCVVASRLINKRLMHSIFSATFRFFTLNLLPFVALL